VSCDINKKITMVFIALSSMVFHNRPLIVVKQCMAASVVLAYQPCVVVSHNQVFVSLLLHTLFEEVFAYVILFHQSGEAQEVHFYLSCRFRCVCRSIVAVCCLW